MKLPISLLTLLSTTSALVIPSVHQPQHIFTNAHDAGYRIPSIHESAIMARRILHLSTLGTLVTSFPSSTTTTSSNEDEIDSLEKNRPQDVSNSPIGLLEYYADCEADGNPTLLAIDIATPYKNYKQGSNVSLAVRWWPRTTTSYSTSTLSSDDDEEIPTPHTPAALPRFSLHGHLVPIRQRELEAQGIPACFLQQHPDSVFWQPGNEVSHESEYVRFVVEHVYWFGGFGDRARIGWLPIEEWRGVRMEEVTECLLPGEEGYVEGDVCGFGEER